MINVTIFVEYEGNYLLSCVKSVTC